MTTDEALKNAKILEAFAKGKTIQFLCETDETWIDISDPIFNFESNVYRVKPERKLVPFTIEDAKLFRDKWLYSKNRRILTKIIHIEDDSVTSVTIGTGEYFSYSELLRSFEFEDGSSCGKYVEE